MIFTHTRQGPTDEPLVCIAGTWTGTCATIIVCFQCDCPSDRSQASFVHGNRYATCASALSGRTERNPVELASTWAGGQCWSIAKGAGAAGMRRTKRETRVGRLLVLEAGIRVSDENSNRFAGDAV
jgi:hypothetical protein